MGVDNSKTGPDTQRKKPDMGIFVRGMYIGSGTQEYQTRDGMKRARSALVVALPGLAGSLEIGCGRDAAVREVQEVYHMGTEIEVQIDVPRCYNNRLYISGIRVGDISLG